MSVIIGKEEYFKEIKEIKFEGVDSDNPLAYRFYDKDKMVLGKPMKDHFKFAIAYWHSFVNTGNDPFGSGTKQFQWSKSTDVFERAHNKMDAAFEFISKLGLEYFCFHDFDLIDEGKSLIESEERLVKIVEYGKKKLIQVILRFCGEPQIFFQIQDI